jgi:hypothetical protein
VRCATPGSRWLACFFSAAVERMLRVPVATTARAGLCRNAAAGRSGSWLRRILRAGEGCSHSCGDAARTHERTDTDARGRAEAGRREVRCSLGWVGPSKMRWTLGSYERHGRPSQQSVLRRWVCERASKDDDLTAPPKIKCSWGEVLGQRGRIASEAEMRRLSRMHLLRRAAADYWGTRPAGTTCWELGTIDPPEMTLSHSNARGQPLAMPAGPWNALSNWPPSSISTTPKASSAICEP